MYSLIIIALLLSVAFAVVAAIVAVGIDVAIGAIEDKVAEKGFVPAEELAVVNELHRAICKARVKVGYVGIGGTFSTITLVMILAFYSI